MSASQRLRFVFAGGGTGGHLYPAIAIADRVRDLLGGSQQADILFVGTRRGLEYRLGDRLGYPLHLVNIRGIARRFSLGNLLVPLLVVTSLFSAGRLLHRFRPHVVVGTGGYAAWPVARAAVARRIPLILQEQNSFPGMVTRRLAAHARTIFLGFEQARRYLPDHANTVVTGNPVRAAITSGDRARALQRFGLSPERRTILVLGGSQGARALNRAVLASLRKQPLGSGYQLLWQTGKRDHAEVMAALGDLAAGHAVFAFTDHMPDVYAAADIAVARAGALTLAELAACRVPAVLVPYPHAAGDHQRRNAEALVTRGCARLVGERELSERDILDDVIELLETGQAETMRGMLAACAPDEPAADVIAREVIAVAEEQRQREERSAG